MQIIPEPSPRAHRKLPERPDIDQLRKQAKDLLHAFESNDPAAVADVREHFRIDGVFTLSQAQLVLARTYGFDSWPKLKAFVDGVSIKRLFDVVNTGDATTARELLRRRPEMINMDLPEQGERKLIHVAVDRHDVPMFRMLLEQGANPRIGIWPHRESTSALRMATERGLTDLLAILDQVEAQKREEMSCPNVTISPDQEILAALIHANRNDEAIAMLDADPELMKQCDRDGGSPLHVACSVANETIVNWLCDHRANANKPDINGQTPIDRAACALHWRAQERLEPLKRIITRLRFRGAEHTPRSAAAVGDIEVLRLLHEQKHPQFTNGNFRHGGILTTATNFGQIESVRCLLDLGLNPDEPIALGGQEDEAWSWGGPLWHAAAFGRLDIATLLLDRRANPNANVYASGWPLDRAYERNDRAMIDLLFSRGATPSIYTVCAAHDHAAAQKIVDARGDDAHAMREMVWGAATSTNLPAFEMAFDRFVARQDRLSLEECNWHDLLCQPMRDGKPREEAAPSTYRDDDRFTIIARMLDSGVDPNVRGGFGLTLLHFVAARELPAAYQVRFATLLLDAGADPALKDTLLCSSALGWACRYGRDGLVDLYLSRSVPTHEPETPEWARPEEWARKMNHLSILAKLTR